MIPAANRFTALLDASVLFPNMKRDILLRFFEADLYRARWTEEITVEWTTRLAAKFPMLEPKVRRTEQLIRDNFEDAWVDAYQPLVDALELPDPNDRHVLAAAITCRAQYIVTDNVRHFPETELARFGIEAGTADKFLAGTFELYWPKALADLREHRAGLSTSPRPSGYVMLLRRAHLPLLASQVQAHLHLI